MAAAAIDEKRGRLDRIVDIVTVVLISLAALGTAWCSYQSARWSALQALNYSKANAARVEASMYADRANAHRIVHILIFAEWQRAVDEHDSFAQFIRRRFDPPLQRAVEAWLATDPLHRRDAPPTPFAMAAYHLREQDDQQKFTRLAEDLVERAVVANETSDRYVFVTVLFAFSSFLGGIAIKLRRPVHAVAASIGVAIFLITLATMMRYPIR